METSNIPESQTLQAQARRLGGVIFPIGAVVQGFLTGLIVLGVMTRNYYYLTRNFYDEPLTWKGLMQEYAEGSPLLIGIAISVLAMAIAAIWLGRWAGISIGVKKWRYGWVGMAVAILLAALATGLTLVVCYVMDESFARDLRRDSLSISIVLGLMYFVPGLATGILSGLVVRQRLRGKVEQMQQPHP
jgi:hypothetical protein